MAYGFSTWNTNSTFIDNIVLSISEMSGVKPAGSFPLPGKTASRPHTENRPYQTRLE